MADKEFVCTPVDMVAKPPAGNKGGPGLYDGEAVGPLGGYKRTSSPNAAPEKLRDGSMPSVHPDVMLADKFPKNLP